MAFSTPSRTSLGKRTHFEVVGKMVGSLNFCLLAIYVSPAVQFNTILENFVGWQDFRQLLRCLFSHKIIVGDSKKASEGDKIIDVDLADLLFYALKSPGRNKMPLLP